MSTRMAFSKAFRVMILSGVMSFSIRSVMRRPLCSARRMRCEFTAGTAARPGSIMPIASVRDAIVLAVPITMQVPAEGKSEPWTSSSRSSSKLPALYSAHVPRQSEHAPSTLSSKRPPIIGPAVTQMAGISALAAPMSCAGRVLSQPPSSTTPSMGWPLIISSVSIERRFLKNMAVGFKYISPKEMVGNSSGRPPVCQTPRLTASAISLRWRWQGLSSLQVWAMPTMGFSRSSFVRPNPRA